MKTIAQQLNVTDFPFKIKDKQGNEIYFENSEGFWAKYEYDSVGKRIYYEDSDGDWSKYEYDSVGNRIYYENSKGIIRDNRPKEAKIQYIRPKEIITLNGIKYQRIDE